MIQGQRSVRATVLAALAVVAALVLAGCTGGSNAVDPNIDTNGFRYTSATKVGTLIPVGSRQDVENVSGTLLDGGTFALGAGRGHVQVVNFWGTWCGPCTTETPAFDGVYRQVKSQGIDFVGVDIKDQKDSARSFVTDNQISYPIVFDQPARLAVELGKIPARGLPFTLLIDKHMRVAAVWFGAVQPKDLQPALAKLAAES